MGSLFHSLSAVSVILILTACGYVCSMLGWIKPDAKAFLSKYLMRFAVPVMCIYSLRSNLTMELLKGSWRLLLVPTLCSAILFLLSGFVGKRLRLLPKQQSVFMMMCSVSNAMFIGYSMCRELFGEICTPHVMLYFLVNTAYTQLVGITMIRRSSGRDGHSVKDTILAFFKTPSILGVLFGVLLIIVDWHPPELLMTCARYINNTVTPLALLMSGHIIHEIGLKNLRVDRTLGAAMCFRFLIAPALCVLLCIPFKVDGLARSVLVVQTAMPVLTQTVVASTEYGGDEQLAAQGIALSTLACFVVIPVLMLLL
ncbi:MAG: AEC family transporter [Oscillospiraceae bacterium]|nr:AEC family transporter [Oscillospiraceae bacterium]